MHSRLFFILFILGSLGMAEEPQIPAATEDPLFPKDFFDHRAQTEPCRTKTDQARAAYDESSGALNVAIARGDSASAIGRLEDQWLKRKRSLIQNVFQCQCATHPVEKREIGDSVWYVSDGTCSVHGEDSATRYGRARDFLKGARNYPQYRGGFSHVLEFVSVDPQTGKILWNLNDAPSPADIFISVRGPDVLGFVTSISYFFGSTFGETPDHKEFSIQFNSKRPTKGFRTPRVYHLPAAGRVNGQFENERVEAQQFHIPSVRGSWYLNSDGRIRYFTAADFGELLQGSSSLANLLGTDLARSILSETLFDLSEVARGRR